jgi:hypothetical protein
MNEDEQRAHRRDLAARSYESVADRLELTARHLRRTAEHFRAGDVPRACAHALAARGDLVAAERSLDELAIEHASHASV